MQRNVEHIIMNMLIESGLTVFDSRQLITTWGVPLLEAKVVEHATAGKKLVVELTWGDCDE